MKNGEDIIFNGVSNYMIKSYNKEKNEEYKKPIDIFTSEKYDGQWDSKGKYLSNIYFKDRNDSMFDIVA